MAQLVALAMPEARVIGLREHASNGFSIEAVACLDPLAERIDAVLVGPGMRDEPATAALVHALLPGLEAAGTSIVLDACAMGALLHPPASWPQGMPWRFERPVILTPHAGEMAHLTGIAQGRHLRPARSARAGRGARLECGHRIKRCAYCHRNDGWNVVPA